MERGASRGVQRRGGTAFAVPLAALSALAIGCGRHEGPGAIEGAPVPESVIAARARAQAETAGALAGKPAEEIPAKPAQEILFGDLHVHTTFSADAFMMALPILQGEGVHPVADACDYARYCSALDFWSITDHAESLTPRRWRETKESIRQCNARSGDPANPDLVSFLGWEWTQIGRTPADHYGHKNVILHDTAEDRVPVRPIHSASFAARAMRQGIPLTQRVLWPLLDWPNHRTDLDMMKLIDELRDTPSCPEGVDVHDLPANCSEGAATPEALYAKLDQWGFDTLVIPHGTTWGIYTPPGSAWDKQLNARQHDPARQRLIEVYSGHGNSEEYRSFREVELGADGQAECPAPRDGYEPCCWRAGEIIRSRCEDPKAAVCEERVQAARQNFLAAGAQGRLTVPGTEVTDWGDCGTCPDCFLPAFDYRPKSSVQYILALSNFDGTASAASPGANRDPLHFRFGFIASSDNHTARPGTGYKEFDRIPNTEARGPKDATWYDRMMTGRSREPSPESVPFDVEHTRLANYQTLDFERAASFFLTGGLVAVHAEGRSRDAIWQALKQRDVYGTSGPRILLWFDLLNAPGGSAPMGSEVRLAENPRFRVRAAGSFEQLPGCPSYAEEGLPAERLARLCRGECYNPSNVRHRITRLEVVRIRPQARSGEPVDDLIEDPWRVLPCPSEGEGCTAEFQDPDFLAGNREALYYVRAIQEPTPAVNAGELRCQKRNEEGICLEVKPCYGDYRTDRDDDCLAPAEERAWSSPIFVDVAGSPAAAGREE